MSKLFKIKLKKKKGKGKENITELIDASFENSPSDVRSHSEEHQASSSNIRRITTTADLSDSGTNPESGSGANEISQHLLSVTKDISEATDLLSPLKAACSLMIRGLQIAQNVRDNRVAWKDIQDDLSYHISELKWHRDSLETRPDTADGVCLKAIESYLCVSLGIIENARRHITQPSPSLLDNLKTGAKAQQEMADLKRERERILNAWQIYHGAMNRVLSQKLDGITDRLVGLKELQLANPVRERVQDNYGTIDTGFAIAYGERVDVCEAGTRVEILAKIQSWSIEKSTEKQIFWLNDAAGTGKTTISATLTRRWASEGRLAGRFFFSPNSSTTETTRDFCIAVAKDIATNQPTLANTINEAIKATPASRRAWFDVQLRTLVIDPLQALESTDCVVLVVDALDNCIDDKERTEFLRAFLQHLHLARNMKLFLTSRPLQDIFDTLAPSPLVHGADVQLLNVRKSDNSDISIYVEQRLRSIISPEQQEMIVSRSGGLFLFAATLCRMLEKGRHRNDILKVLSDVGVTEKLERKMDILYLSALKQAVVDKDANKLMMSVLSLIIIAYQPLSINTLRKFLSDNLHVKDFVQDLSSVLKDGDPDRPVKVLHPTFREFVLSNEERANGFVVNPITSSAAMAIACIDTLEQFLSEDIFRLDQSGRLPVRNADIIDLDLIINTHTTAAERYASAFWAHHVAVSEIDPQLWSRVLRFISHKFLNWVELMSWRESLGICIEGLTRLHAKFRTGTSTYESHIDANQSLIIRHARQFVAQHQTLISNSALQTYSVALFFTPPDIPFFRHFRQQYTERLPRIITEYASEWTSCTTLGGHGGSIHDLSISPTGSRIISIGKDARLQLWDAETGALVGRSFQGRTSGHMQTVYNHKFSSDGSRFAFHFRTGELHVRLSHTGDLIRPPIEVPRECALSSTMASVFFAEKHFIQRLDIKKGQDVSPITDIGALPDGLEVIFMAISPDGQTLICLGRSPTTKWECDIILCKVDPFHHLSSQRYKCEFPSFLGTDVFFTPDSTRVITFTNSRLILLYESATGIELMREKDDRNHPSSYRRCIAFCPLNRYLAHGTNDSEKISIREQRTGQTITTIHCCKRIDEIQTYGIGIADLSFSPDGQRLASVSLDQVFRIWVFQEKELLQSISIRDRSGMSLGVLFPDWSQVVVASADNQVQLRDLQGDVEEYMEEYVADNNATVNNYEDEEEVALQNYLKALEEARFDGYLEVLGASFVSPVIGLRIDELEVHLWDVETSKVIKILRDPIEGIINVAFSPNGQLMATLSCASTIQLWDGKTLEAIGDRISKFSYSKVESDGLIFFSSDSQLLGANHHGCAAVMNVQERNQVWSFGKLGHISDLGFRLYAISHDNSKVAGVVNASEILVWDLDRTTRMRTGVRRSPPGYYTFTVGAFSPADSSLLAIARPTHVDIWQIDTEIRLLNQISLEEPIYGNISFSSDGQYLAYGPLCWDVLTSSPDPIPYSSNIPPDSFRKTGFNTHSFLSYEEGWIHSLFPPGPVLPIPTELRMIELDKRWHISDERVFFIGKRGLPVFIDCSPILARARQE